MALAVEQQRTLVCMLTDGCNLSCTHCFKSLLSHAETPFEAFTRSVEGMMEFFGKPYLVLTGGEPTIHTRIVDIIDYIIAQGLRCHIVTNTLTLPELLPKYIEMGPALRCLAISLEGANRETHDRVRGRGAFDRALEACDTLKANGIAFRFCFTITRFNLHQLDQLLDLAEQMEVPDGVYAWPAFWSKYLHDRDLILTEDERDYLAAKLSDFAARGGILCGDIHRMDSLYQECDFIPMKNLTLDSDGNVSLCCNLTKNRFEKARMDVIGSPLHEDFGEIIRKHMMLQMRYRADLFEDFRRMQLSGLDRYQCHRCQKYFKKFD